MNQKGFMQIIVIIILIVIIISLLGISLKEIYIKLSGNQAVNENFSFIGNWLTNLYNTYLSGPIGNLLISFKNSLIGIFKNTATQQIQSIPAIKK